MQSINPADGEVIRTYETLNEQQTAAILARSQEAFALWRRTSFEERAGCFRRAAERLRKRSHDFGSLITQEMGKAFREAKAEAEKCAWVCEHYAANAERYLSDEVIPTEARRSFVTFQPLGVLLAVMPWNFPFWQVFRFAAPSLMAGNVAVLKHASNVSGCALAIEDLFLEAGFPENVFRALLIESRLVASVIENPYVRAVTLTGSSAAGREVASIAGRALKKCVMELGGSDPFVVLEDADLDAAVDLGVRSRTLNAGQSCIAAKRFVVVDAVADRFEALFVERMKRVRMGDPLSEKTDMGPLARRDLRDDLHRQVRVGIERDAQLLLGGEIPEGPGAFYPPTVLTQVGPGMPAYHEEIFGPVAAIIRARDEEDAVRIANDTAFGLGAAVFTRDLGRGEWIAAERLEAGCCFVNDVVRSDPRLPFGGIKESGFGRELSHYGIKEFVNIKTVSIR
ncbi:MAG: NAD-dependent succinate-semialdehyde dehydrogenase [Thermodesulfobacteriota bacterium]|nr:NAD-dependent succinate-semialdehyde dehydrogenase [Thermodesulfobacteriota bacterium]